MSSHSEIEKIQQAIQVLEAQRRSLGEAVVETALAPLRARLVSLEAGSVYEQRKQASVLFADLVGSTSLASRLDAEDMRELLNAYFERCRQIIEAHGGVASAQFPLLRPQGDPPSLSPDPLRKREIVRIETLSWRMGRPYMSFLPPAYGRPNLF